MKHTAPHDLPTSNGYGGGHGQPITVHCGRCKGSFSGDREWADRYLAMIRRQLDRVLNKPGPYGINQAQYDEAVAGYVADFAGLT